MSLSQLQIFHFSSASKVPLFFFLLLPLENTFYSLFLALLYSSFARSRRFGPFKFAVAATGDGRRAFVIVATPFCYVLDFSPFPEK